MMNRNSRDESLEGRDAQTERCQEPTPTSPPSALPKEATACRDRIPIESRKRGLVWTFKKGGRFGADELTISVVDIREKRVTLAAQLGGTDITCSGPATLELQLVSLTLLVEDVGQQKTRIRIVSRQRITIQRN